MKNTTAILIVRIIEITKPWSALEELTNVITANKLRMSDAERIKAIYMGAMQCMLNNPEYTIEYIAAQCGFKNARQLQRILKT